MLDLTLGILYTWLSTRVFHHLREGQPSQASFGGPHNRTVTELPAILVFSSGRIHCSGYSDCVLLHGPLFVRSNLLGWKHFYLPTSSKASPATKLPSTQPAPAVCRCEGRRDPPAVPQNDLLAAITGFIVQWDRNIPDAQTQRDAHIITNSRN